MSRIIPHKNSKVQGAKFRNYKTEILELDFGENFEPVLVKFDNGKLGRGTCLRCFDAPCIQFTQIELELPQFFEEFPGDPSLEVCPTQAISWNTTDSLPAINDNDCISCGLCISRCPYGAIHITDKGIVSIQVDDPDQLTVESRNITSHGNHYIPRKLGSIGPIRSQPMLAMPNMLTNLLDFQKSRLVRNLLIQCGIPSSIRRKGDTNISMDGVSALSDGHWGVFEIELSNAVLELPRALLVDVAVLHNRYGFEVDKIYPISVVLSLPNSRSEFFRVINDIEQILGLRFRTITVGALLSVLWHLKKITGFTNELFSTNPSSTDLYPSMKQNICKSLSSSEPYPGAYRPIK